MCYKKTKKLRHRLSSSLCVVEFWQFYYKRRRNIVVPHKTVFGMLCICKTETTYADIAVLLNITKWTNQ